MLTWNARAVGEVLKVPTATDDKYSRGVLGVYTGSIEFPGAAVLGVEAAARTGVGMIRYLGTASAAVLARRPETVTVSGQVQAWLIGSGIARLAPSDPVLAEAIASGVPLVLDAGALWPETLALFDGALAQAHSGQRATRILTPHAGEAARLLGCTRSELEADRSHAAQELAERTGATVLLKGSVSIVAQSGTEQIELGPATPWLATAGTGDVLAGIVGAVLATSASAEPQAIAASAAWLHEAAARRASDGGPIVALDVAEALPETIRSVLG